MLGPSAGFAKAAGLRYVNDRHTPGIRRIGRTRVRYVAPSGRTIADVAELRRIKALAIPPAWTDVWICPNPHGHLQATGRDARGRKQYRYHPAWRHVRDEAKYGMLTDFARALPRIRRATDADLRRAGLPREKVLATVVRLLEQTMIRVGNDEYARDNGSIGLTTMHDRHATVRGAVVHFEFRGKRRVAHATDLRDARLARIVKACRDLPGHELFQYVDGDGDRQSIGSADVNAYLRAVAGADFTAKDFRTWAGTVLAAEALAACETCESERQAKRNVIHVVESVAARLGNTRAVCRRCYIHPDVIDAYFLGVTIQPAGRTSDRASRRGLSRVESAVVRLLQRGRLKAA